MIVYPKTKAQIINDYNEFLTIEKSLSFLLTDDFAELMFRYGHACLSGIIECDFSKPYNGFFSILDETVSYELDSHGQSERFEDKLINVSQENHDMSTFCDRYSKEIRRFQMLRENSTDPDRFDNLIHRAFNQIKTPNTFETVSHVSLNSGEIDVFTLLKRSAYSEHNREQQQIFELFDVDIVIFDKNKEQSICWMSGEAHGACFDHDVDEAFYKAHIEALGDDYSQRAADMLCNQIRLRGELLSDYMFSYDYLAHTLTCHIHMVRIRDANKRMEFKANATPMDIFTLAETNFKNNEHAIETIKTALKGITPLDFALFSSRELKADLFDNFNKRIALTESNMIPYIGFSVIAINQCVIYQGHPFAIENELLNRFDNKIHTTRTMEILDRITSLGNDVKSFHHVTL